MACLDVDELDEMLESRNLLTDDQHAAVSFPSGKHLRDYQGSVASRIRSFLRSKMTDVPVGPIRLITQLRQFGFYFSPLNLFIVGDEDRPEVIVAEVNNIPWGEQQLYLLAPRWDDSKNVACYEHAKEMHVSPFLPMNHRYRWEFQFPTNEMFVGLANIEDNTTVFQASMKLQKFVLDRSTLQRFLWTHPLMSWKVVAAIYWQAFKLWWKKCPLYSHPHIEDSAATITSAAEPPLPKLL